MENSLRGTEHQRNEETEWVLSELTQLLGDVGKDHIFSSNEPTVFIVGCARSGTTVLTQYLAASNLFCYPTNFISRFYFNPYIGALLQYLMFNLDKKDELFGNQILNSQFISELGKTKGALSPHEFWYYWRRFFAFDEIQKLSDKAKDKIDRPAFLNGLNAIKEVFQKPLMMKAMIVNWDIPLLAEIVPNSYFIFMDRDIAHNAYSLLKAREKFFNTNEQWYSFKPLEYRQIRTKAPHQQVVDQVYHTNKAIEKGLKELPSHRYLKISYEDFCRNPSFFIQNVCQLLKINYTSAANNTEPAIRQGSSNNYEIDSWNIIKSYSQQYR